MPLFIDVFEQTLRTGALPAALRLLNAGTPHRFTGVYRFEGSRLRNVALFDRWNPEMTRGDDAPMGETFCAIVPTQDGQLEVLDGRSDARFPWMNTNAVASYCGVLIRTDDGDPFGTICHFDVERCEAASTQFKILQAAAPLIYRAVMDGAAEPSPV
jgi:hypothetical protein